MKIAVFSGSFDPFTLGHLDIVLRGATLFDQLHIVIAKNSQKQGWLPIDVRVQAINAALSAIDPILQQKINVDIWEGLTADFATKVGAKFLLRGLRNAQDLEWEQTIAWGNSQINKELETIFLVTPPTLRPVSSSLVREFCKHSVDCSTLVPQQVIPYLAK